MMFGEKELHTCTHTCLNTHYFFFLIHFLSKIYKSESKYSILKFELGRVVYTVHILLCC